MPEDFQPEIFARPGGRMPEQDPWTRMSMNIEALLKTTAEIKETLGKDFVTQDQFAPVKMIVFGLVGLLLMGIVGAIVRQALK